MRRPVVICWNAGKSFGRKGGGKILCDYFPAPERNDREWWVWGQQGSSSVPPMSWLFSLIVFWGGNEIAARAVKLSITDCSCCWGFLFGIDDFWDTDFYPRHSFFLEGFLLFLGRIFNERRWKRKWKSRWWEQRFHRVAQKKKATKRQLDNMLLPDPHLDALSIQ